MNHTQQLKRNYQINMETPFLVNHKTFGDHRGNFCQIVLNMKQDKRLDKLWVQVNTSISVDPYTLRGLHFQDEPFAQAKYMKVVYGKIINFVVCIDKSRPDFGSVYHFEINKDQAVMVPRGFANGLLTLEPNTVIQYLVDNSYKPDCEHSLTYNSVPEVLEIVKNYTSNPIISEKDANGILWDDYKK